MVGNAVSNAPRPLPATCDDTKNCFWVANCFDQIASARDVAAETRNLPTPVRSWRTKPLTLPCWLKCLLSKCSRTRLVPMIAAARTNVSAIATSASLGL